MAAKENLAADAARLFCGLNRAAAQPIFAGDVRNELVDGAKVYLVNTPAPKKPDFERSLARLEEVVRRLESPQLSLDDAMKLFEEGVALSRECQKQLEEAEGRVEILLKKADGKLAAEPFDPERDGES